MDVDMVVFAQRLKLCRQRKGLTQLGLAMALDFDKNAISRYETGRQEPRASTVILLARYFHVSSAWLAGAGETL